jgi:hypothetical protein
VLRQLGTTADVFGRKGHEILARRPESVAQDDNCANTSRVVRPDDAARQFAKGNRFTPHPDPFSAKGDILFFWILNPRAQFLDSTPAAQSSRGASERLAHARKKQNVPVFVTPPLLPPQSEKL